MLFRICLPSNNVANSAASTITQRCESRNNTSHWSTNIKTYVTYWMYFTLNDVYYVHDLHERSTQKSVFEKKYIVTDLTNYLNIFIDT